MNIQNIYNFNSCIFRAVRCLANLGGVKCCILSHRFYMMGIAMILVILYHLRGSLLPDSNYFLSLFSMGFVGVDFFFFFSALGLCFSFKKNDFCIFLKNRLVRLFPLFIMWAIVHLLYLRMFQNNDFDIIDVFLCLCSLSYYGLGEVRSNWYLSALILFYVLFPLLFQLVKKLKSCTIFLFIIIAIILQYYISFEWYHKTFINRFPIFLLGIYVWYRLTSNDRNWVDDIIRICFIMAILAILIVCLTKKTYLFLMVSLLSPVLMFVLAMIRKPLLKLKLGLVIDGIIRFIGRHSLEFFIGNCWTMLLMNEVSHMNSVEKIVIYIVSNVVFALVLIPMNKQVLSFFNYKLA